MDNNIGAETLVNSIMDEARAAAKKIEAEAAQQVAAIKHKLDDDRLAVKAEYDARAERIRQDTIARALTNAELESRKGLLAKKRALIDRAFAEAYKRICTLPDDKRRAFLKKLLLAECEGGEVIHPAPREDMAAVVQEAAAKLPGGLTMGSADESIRNGFTVEGKGFVKNCSFIAVMDAEREKCETEVAKLLFN